jgi:hypothetical protein
MAAPTFRPSDHTTDFQGVAEAEQILSWPARRWFERRAGSGSASLGSGSKETGAETMRSGGLTFPYQGNVRSPSGTSFRTCRLLSALLIYYFRKLS